MVPLTTNLTGWFRSLFGQAVAVKLTKMESIWETAGNPFMTTDTAAALRAAEIDAEVFLKATKVDGVFDSDPVKNSDAKLHRQLSFRQVMLDGLKVMDETAITLCKENDVKVGLLSQAVMSLAMNIRILIRL